jgi:hypothetical protein
MLRGTKEGPAGRNTTLKGPAVRFENLLQATIQTIDFDGTCFASNLAKIVC